MSAAAVAQQAAAFAAYLATPQAQALDPEAWMDLHREYVRKLVGMGATLEEAADALNAAYDELGLP